MYFYHNGTKLKINSKKLQRYINSTQRDIEDINEKLKNSRSQLTAKAPGYSESSFTREADSYTVKSKRNYSSLNDAIQVLKKKQVD